VTELPTSMESAAARMIAMMPTAMKATTLPSSREKNFLIPANVISPPTDPAMIIQGVS